MSRSYNLGWRIVRQRVQHLLFRLRLINLSKLKPNAFIKGYSGCWGYALILIVSEPFPLWRAQLEMSVIKIQCYSLSQEMGALSSLHTAPDTSWEELRGWRGGALSSFPFLHLSSSLHNSVSEASSTLVKCLPSSLSVKADFLKAAFICFTISLSPPLFEISHDRASLS